MYFWGYLLEDAMYLQGDNPKNTSLSFLLLIKYFRHYFIIIA